MIRPMPLICICETLMLIDGSNKSKLFKKKSFNFLDRCRLCHFIYTSEIQRSYDYYYDDIFFLIWF